MRQIKAPCPGCGEPNKYRLASEVCSDCKALLKRAQAMEKDLSQKKDEVFVKFGERYHWNKYIHTRGGINSDKIMIAFQNLALAASRPAYNPDYENAIEILLRYDSYGGGSKFYLMDKKTAEAILELRSLMDTLIDSVYESGKRDGHNLLMRLASGDLSPNEYMQETEESS